MKFKDKYPKPPISFTGHPDLEVEPGLFQTDRVFECDACRKLTGFVVNVLSDSPGVHCCSEECRVVIDANNGIERVFTPVVDHLLDMEKEVGPIPTTPTEDPPVEVSSWTSPSSLPTESFAASPAPAVSAVSDGFVF